VVIDHPAQLLPGEKTQRVKCRMRSLGCVPCTGAIRSDADTVPKIIEEMVSFRRSERENRAIDHDEKAPWNSRSARATSDDLFPKNIPHSTFSTFLEQDLNTELLRFTTAGSVDDGKSTLIGRLLHDSKAVYEDQLASMKKSRINRSTGPLDFSLLTDGLRAEREQGITIDVAYRYFATARRKFIIADTPGHEQYTRNMATGASTADLAVILIDGTKGILPQTRRHAFIASLLGISNVLAAVTKWTWPGIAKMSSASCRTTSCRSRPSWNCQRTMRANQRARRRQRRRPQQPYALVSRSNAPGAPRNRPSSRKGFAARFRFPVQTVIRPDATFRGFAGRIASGSVHPGDPLVALPSGRKNSRALHRDLRRRTTAGVFLDVRDLAVDEEIDLSRGEMLVSADQLPRVSRRFHAKVVWLHGTSLELGRAYLVNTPLGRRRSARCAFAIASTSIL